MPIRTSWRCMAATSSAVSAISVIGRAPRDQPAEVGGGLVAELDVDRALDVVAGEGQAVAQVDDPLAHVETTQQLGRVDRLDGREVDGRGPGTVDRRHVGVVRGVGVQARQEVADEVVLVRRGQRLVLLALLADRRGLGLAGVTAAAEAAEAVGGVDRGVVGELGETAGRVELGAGELLGQVGGHKVGAADGAEEHGAAGEHGHLLAVLLEREGQVGRRVAGRVDHAHGELADLDDGHRPRRRGGRRSPRRRR